MSAPLLQTKQLSKVFSAQGMSIQALRNVSLSIAPRQTLGIVGESGSGKSTLGKLMMGLYKPTSGDILYRGSPIRRKDRQAFQYIFQDPYASLNPRMCVADIIAEPFIVCKRGARSERADRVEQALKLVGLDVDHKNRYPTEFSGGQRQRISIARALITTPECIICDEPTTALDVSIQAQILNLLKQLQDELGLTYLFISHNLAVVRYISTNIAVLYQGEVVEMKSADALFETAEHPYTKQLLSSIPTVPQRTSPALQILDTV